MTKNKKKKSSVSQQTESRPSLLEVLGLKRVVDIFLSERLHFFLGMVLFAMSVCMIGSFFSYLTTGADDQSIIENPHPGELNTLGTMNSKTFATGMSRTAAKTPKPKAFSNNGNGSLLNVSRL